jgi:hypothetical protein
MLSSTFISSEPLAHAPALSHPASPLASGVFTTSAARVLSTLATTAHAARTRDDSFHARMLAGAVASLSKEDFATLVAAIDAARSSGHGAHVHVGPWGADSALRRLFARFAGADDRVRRGVDPGALLRSNIAATCADEFAALVDAVQGSGR